MPKGKVEKLEGEYAIVHIERQEMCGDCHACDAVHTPKKCTLKCANTCKVKEGDEVEVSLDNETFLKATFIMYGTPFLGFISGLWLGYLLGKVVVSIDVEVLMILGSILGMALTFCFVKSRDKKRKYQKMLPRITSIKKDDFYVS